MKNSNSKTKKTKGNYKLFGNVYSVEDTVVGWLFLTPATILGIIFVIAPMIISLSYAFTDANLLRLDRINWVGLSNFKRVFSDGAAKKALMNSVQFVIKVVPLQLGLALGLALLLNKQKKGSTFLRWVFFSPVMLSLAVTSFLWLNLLNPQSGLINSIIVSLGFEPQQFLKSPAQALNIIVLISAWQGAGYQMLIFLAGLKNVPGELYEASSIDGATRLTNLRYITMPLILPTFSFVLITMLIGAFRIIVQPMIMTGGGPVDSTMTASYYIYTQGIVFRDVGYSSTIAMVFTAIIAAVALTLRRLFKEEDN